MCADAIMDGLKRVATMKIWSGRLRGRKMKKYKEYKEYKAQRTHRVDARDRPDTHPDSPTRWGFREGEGREGKDHACRTLARVSAEHPPGIFHPEAAT